MVPAFVRSTPLRRQRHWLLTVLAFVAVVAQTVVAFAPLAEGRDGRMAAHVESSGTPTGHYLHNDATCAACQARSIHGTTSHASVAIAATQLAPSVVVDLIDRAVSSELHPQQNPRAPPQVI